MKEIVFDTSTLILLAKITLIRDVAKKIKVIIPAGVMYEALMKKDLFDAKIINELIKQGMITTIKTTNAREIEKEFNLGKGEIEALNIAKSKKILLATDDKPTIKACKILDIKFLTAIHFLLMLYHQKIIAKDVALEKLKKYGRYNPEIIKRTKNIIESKKWIG